MGKTRRKLYGRSRRRQRGGVCLSRLLLAGAAIALASASPEKEKEKEPTLGELISNYVKGGVSWEDSKALADRIASYSAVLTTFPTFSSDVKGELGSCGGAPLIVTPVPGKVNIPSMKNGGIYKDKDGREFEVDTWRTKGNNDFSASVRYTDDDSVGKIDAKGDVEFEVVSPPKEFKWSDDEYGGRRRRKTLRRKK
jgi:hypothetical protein